MSVYKNFTKFDISFYCQRSHQKIWILSDVVRGFFEYFFVRRPSLKRFDKAKVGRILLMCFNLPNSLTQVNLSFISINTEVFQSYTKVRQFAFGSTQEKLIKVLLKANNALSQAINTINILS